MKKIALICAIGATLSACGGGGGGDSGSGNSTPHLAGSSTTSTATAQVNADSPGSSTTAVTFPVNAALTNFVTAAHDFTASYTDSATNDVYTLSYGYAPGGDTSFEGKAAKTSIWTLDVKKNGVRQGANSETGYFQINPYKPLGAIFSTGEYIVSENQAILPGAGKVGDSGPLDTSTSYPDSSKTSIYSRGISTWELQVDTSSTAWLCINSTSSLTNGSASVISSECYKIDTNGSVLGNKITLTINGKSITISS